MKTLINFAAQQLSKKRMNEVKGGTTCRAYSKASGQEIARGNFPGQTTAGATVKMEIELNRAGWKQGSYTVSCA